MSLSGCASAIIGGFPLDRIDMIITGAQVDFSTLVGVKEWVRDNHLPKSAEQILMQLYEGKKIRVVDRETASPDREGGDWLLAAEMSSYDDYPKMQDS